MLFKGPQRLLTSSARCWSPAANRHWRKHYQACELTFKLPATQTSISEALSTTKKAHLIIKLSGQRHKATQTKDKNFWFDVWTKPFFYFYYYIFSYLLFFEVKLKHLNKKYISIKQIPFKVYYHVNDASKILIHFYFRSFILFLSLSLSLSQRHRDNIQS